MKLYTECHYCKSEISFRAWVIDRVDYKMTKGNFVLLSCKHCKQSDHYHIERCIAKENRKLRISSLVLCLIIAPVLLFKAWDYLPLNNIIHRVGEVVGILAVPFSIYIIILCNDTRRVRLFNYS
jgi:hypothetical protein